MVSPSSQSDEPTVTSISLIQRIRSKDDVSWSRFVDFYSPLIWSWCRGSGLDPNDADDVSQEVFTAVARAITQYEQNGSFRGWLWQITRNKMFDHFRALQRGPRVTGGSDFGNWLGQIPEIPPDDLSVSTMGDSLALRALELIRNEFEESTWTAFVRMVFEKQTAAEIAVELGWAGPDGSVPERGAKRVRQAKFRVMKRLRDEFGEILDLS